MHVATNRRGGKDRLARRLKSAERLLFHYPLCLSRDESDSRQAQFIRSYVQLGNWLVEVRGREQRKRWAKLRKDQREHRQKHSAVMSALAIIRDVVLNFGDKTFDIGKARHRLLATGLDKEELRKLFENSVSPVTEVEERQLADKEADLARSELESKVEKRRLRRKEQHLEDAKLILDAMQRLFDAASERDEEAAAVELHEAAQIGCALLGFLATKKPGLLRPSARISLSWPILMGISPDGHKKVAEKLKQLQLGADTIYGRLRIERAFRETTPARRYARLLVETIWTNRLLIPELSERLHAMQIMDPNFTSDFQDLPTWLKLVAALPSFGISTVAQWGATAREILRAECPDFHLRPEWSSVRAAFEPREKGRIQNKILDKVVSAMRTIAKSEASAIA